MTETKNPLSMCVLFIDDYQFDLFANVYIYNEIYWP